MITLVDHLPADLPQVVGLDIETSMIGKNRSDPFQDHILSIQVSDGKDCWILADAAHFNEIVPLLEDRGRIKVLHNAGFDLQFLVQQLGAKPSKASIHDSLLCERVLNMGRDLMRHALDEVLARRFGIMVNKSIRSSFANHSGTFSQEQLDYMAQDVLYLPQLYALQLGEVSKLGLGKVVALENQIVLPVVKATLRGVGFDHELWNKYIKEIAAILKGIEQDLTSLTDLGGQQDLLTGQLLLGFNPHSAVQVKRVLNQAGINVDDTNENTLLAYLNTHPTDLGRPLLEKIMEFREWAKRQSWGYNEKVSPVTGRIHTSWNQIEADTGRFSSSKPNLQNIPRPEPNKPNFRYLFPPAPGYCYAIADFNQQEPRILAELSRDAGLLKACSEGDVYIGMVKVAEGKVVAKNDPLRQDYKQAVLGLFYGGSPETISEVKHIPLKKVQMIQHQAQKAFMGVFEYARHTKFFASTKGYTRTLLGRVRYYSDIEEGRPPRKGFWNEAVNMPVQGSGADAFKLALNLFDDCCREHGYDAYAILFEHDELVVEVRRDQAEEVYYQLVGCMESAGRELCPHAPLLADGVIADRWEKT